MHVAVCRFHDVFGEMHFPGCPHESAEDQEGPITPTGWTVQQA